jgi:hypothetical protein
VLTGDRRDARAGEDATAQAAIDERSAFPVSTAIVGDARRRNCLLHFLYKGA